MLDLKLQQASSFGKTLTTNPSSGKRVPLSVTPIMGYANSYLRVKVLKFTGPSYFSYERRITPLEGLKVLKQLKN